MIRKSIMALAAIAVLGTATFPMIAAAPRGDMGNGRASIGTSNRGAFNSRGAFNNRGVFNNNQAAFNNRFVVRRSFANRGSFGFNNRFAFRRPFIRPGLGFRPGFRPGFAFASCSVVRRMEAWTCRCFISIYRQIPA